MLPSLVSTPEIVKMNDHEYGMTVQSLVNTPRIIELHSYEYGMTVAKFREHASNC